MENYEKPYKQMRRLNVLLVIMISVCLAVILFLLIVQANSEKPAELPGETLPVATQAVTKPAEEPEVTTEPEETTAEPAKPVVDLAGMMTIETPYLNLRYPMEWESYLRCNQTSSAQLHTVSFECAIANQVIPLFDVYFGYTDMGEQMGYLQMEEQKVPVCVLFYEFVPDDTWREEDTFALYAMQEAANDLVACMMAEENYLPQ